MFRNTIFILVFVSIYVVNGIEFMSDENFVECPNREDFRCSSGSTCIKSELECDGNKDCPDGSDEFVAECDYKLCKAPRYYTCKDVNKTCIVQNFRCDGHNDCPLNDDEENCKNYVPHHEKIECNQNEFTCVLDNMCIPIELVCDGIRQCIDGSDEATGCLDIEKKCKGFLCQNHHCISDKSWVCDGHNDCGDWSDEKNCLSNCTSDNKQFLCNDNVTCLSIEKVCNKDKDCMDGSDEGGICDKFSNNTACESHYCPDDAQCYISPTGPVCVCPTGFLYASNKKMCEDIDECQTYGICTQGCVNTPGSYHCTCVKRFHLKNDNKTCTSISSTEPILLYAEKSSVNTVHLKSGYKNIVTDKVRQVIGVCFDGHYVYWTNVALNTESIVKSRPDGTKMETLLTTGLSLPEDIAVDWITGNIYFSDAMYMHIAVCSSEGKYCTSLVIENVERPRSIALYPQEGRMYWSEWGTSPMIAVAHMDGTFPAPFINENIQWPSGVTLDWPNNRLYWVDAKLSRIESCNLDGTGRRTVIDNVLKHPYGLAVFENDIYWSDWNAMSIESCNKFTCKDRKTIVKDRKVYDLHIYHNSIQPTGKNPCNNHKCTHLCLLASNETFSCGCPNVMKLNPDKLSCSAVVKKESIHIGMRNYLITMEHETFGRHQIEKAKVVPMYIHKMAYNLINGHVFIADNIARRIFDYELQNETTIELVKRNIGKVSSMAFDHLSNNLYWSDSDHGTIEVFSLNTKHRATVHHYMGMEKPIAIALIPEQGQMFVSLKSDLVHAHIDIQSMHGSGDRHHLFEKELGDGQIQFAIDRNINEIYWSDSSLKKISWTDYSGQSLHVFKLISGEPVSLAVLADDVFWTKKNSLDVYYTPKHSPDTTKQLILPQHDYVTKEDQMVLVAVTPMLMVSHPCMVDNGNCSHICVASGAVQKMCLCPPGMTFKNQQNETCVDAIDCEFRCDSGECITTSRVCNNFNDCADASDEKNCDNETDTSNSVSCYRDEFKCADQTQCISQELRCDKTNDCKDKSDEIDCKHYNSETKCHKNQFACPSGLCIDLTAVCDQINDCEDGADELKCHDKHAMKHVCRKNMFTCTSGQCIPIQWVCDETSDCSDGSDEYNCPEKSCPKGYVKCSHGQCIDSSLVCDGFNNCGDNSGELNCAQAEPATICEEFNSSNEPIKFQCTSDKTICLNITARCNGTAECPRGEDEVECSGCRITEFQCKNAKCISKEWRCDKTNDCGDGSDEIGCDNSINATSSVSANCDVGMFDCKDGHCVDMDQVCDGNNDCPNKMDESSTCATACIKSPCKQICTKSPFGPICSCHDGFTLAGDRKSCFDINECKISNPCAQKCENLQGSFRCSCFVDYMLRSDKISCKSIGAPKHILYSSQNVIYDITKLSFGILWSTNSSKIVGMDVNVRQGLLYFTVQYTGALYEMNLENKKVNYVTNIGNPMHLAVDWVTNNVYFYDQATNPSIKICHMAQKVCVRIIQLKYRDVVKSLIIDSANNKIFYSILHPYFSTSESFIYSHNLDGSRLKILLKGSGHINGLSCDSNKQILYYSDLATSEIWSMKYDGSDQKILINNSPYITKPSDLSLFEDHLLVLNVGSKIVAQCKVYGDRECKSFEVNAYNAENLVILQESKQKEKENNCHRSNCSLICVPAELGPKCLCHGQLVVEQGIDCDESNDVKLSPFFVSDEKSEIHSGHSTIATVFSILAIVMGLTFILIGIYYVYQFRFNVRKAFDVSMHFENPSSSTGIDNAQVKMCHPAQLAVSNHYSEVYPNTKQEPNAPALEEYECFTTDRENDTARLIL